MSNFSDFIGGGGSASYPTIFLSKSQTWVPPQDGNICIHVIGAGGGGRGWNDSTGSGAAGGYCKKNTLAVTTSGSFTVVVGAGGAGGANGRGNLGQGGTGGNSTVAGTGLSATLTANGGGGGTSSAGGAGGTASNGDVNNTGGAGAGPSGSNGGAGGGAVGLTSTGQAGSIGNLDIPTAGECDIIGDFWSSTMGQIAGGIAGRCIRKTSGTVPYDAVNGGPFSGGGGVLFNTGSEMLVQGGAGGIGGGGGAGENKGHTSSSLGGEGGEGIVVIQYIP